MPLCLPKLKNSLKKINICFFVKKTSLRLKTQELHLSFAVLSKIRQEHSHL